MSFNKYIEEFNAEFPAELEKLNYFNFVYIGPEHYRERLHSICTSGFTLRIVETGSTPQGIIGQAQLIFTLEGAHYDITVAIFENYTFAKDVTTGKLSQVILTPDQLRSKLNSAGVKAVLRELLVGNYLYKREDPKGVKASAKSAATPAAKSTGSVASPAVKQSAGSPDTWDGSVLMSFGKLKGTAYAEIEEDYLIWAAGKDRPDSGSVHELARRAFAAEAEAIANVHSSDPELEDDETTPLIPF